MKKQDGQKESEITKDIRKALKEMGVFHYKHYSGGKFGQAGISDIIGIYKGKFLAIEVKRPGGKASEKQIKFLNDVNNSGGIGFIAYSVDDVLNQLIYPILEAQAQTILHNKGAA